MRDQVVIIDDVVGKPTYDANNVQIDDCLDCCDDDDDDEMIDVKFIDNDCCCPNN